MKSLYVFRKLICMDGVFGEKYYVRSMVWSQDTLMEGLGIPGQHYLISCKLMKCISRFKGCGYMIERKKEQNEVAYVSNNIL